MFSRTLGFPATSSLPAPFKLLCGGGVGKNRAQMPPYKIMLPQHLGSPTQVEGVTSW